MTGGGTLAPAEVGTFIDGVAGKVRSPSAVAGRLVEEVVELALATGLDAGAIFGHVADALHNQALKASAASGKTVFPTELVGDAGELSEECADVSILLKDLCHVAGGFDLSCAERAKWEKFIQKTFRVVPSGVIYATKPHVVEGVANGSVATLSDNPPPVPGERAWKLHRCADDSQCSASIGGGCARGYCAKYGVTPDEAGVPRYPKHDAALSDDE